MTNDNTTDDRTERLTEIIETQNERINQLEDIVQEQAQAIWPSRRQALKATGAAAIFGAGAVGGASATPGDDGDTVWGSDQNRDDYYVDEMDANLVSTDNARVNSSVSGGRDLCVEHLGADESGSTPLTVSVSGYSVYKIDYYVGIDGNAQDIQLVLNGDSAGNTNYAYVDEAGTSTSSVDAMLLASNTDGFDSLAGSITIHDRKDASDNIGISHELATARAGNFDVVGVSGGRNGAASTSQIDITAGSGFEFGYFDVWGMIDS